MFEKEDAFKRHLDSHEIETNVFKLTDSSDQFYVKIFGKNYKSYAFRGEFWDT